MERIIWREREELNGIGKLPGGNPKRMDRIEGT